MKRILLLTFLIYIVAVLASCNHSHEKASERMYNETHHWYPCSDSECTAVLEKVEHSFTAGAITKQPTPSADGVRSYLCTVCGYLKSEAVKYESVYTVDDIAWRKAFALSEFSNVTAVIEEIRQTQDGIHVTLSTVQANGTRVYIETVATLNGKKDAYVGKLQDGNYLWLFTDKDQGINNTEPIFTTEGMQGTTVLNSRSYGFDRLVDCFSKFTFNEATSSYEAYNLTFDTGNFGYSSVSVKVQDGRVVSIQAVTDEATPTEINATYSNYGTTTPTVPGAEDTETK